MLGHSNKCPKRGLHLTNKKKKVPENVVLLAQKMNSTLLHFIGRFDKVVIKYTARLH